MAQPLHFLFILILLPCLKIEAFLDEVPSDTSNQLDLHAMIAKVCMDVEDQNTCLTNIQNEIVKHGPPTPSSVVTAALRATLNEAMGAIDKISKFSTFSISYREQVAIQDCKELLDFSVSELAWSLGEMRRIRAGDESVDYDGDLQAWLSAALSNQDTCLEGFEGTDRRLQGYISGSLTQVTQLISNVLALYTQLHSLPFRSPANKTRLANYQSSEFPEWMTEGDQELLRSPPRGVHADAVVALDGSGHYRSISEAVDAAPRQSKGRYVIYVTKGIYKENVDLKRTKPNIMLVGEGIGKTIVTGNRNFMQGWTTFRTATVAVSGKGFIARDMSFRNTAGPVNHQAVALRVDSDQSAFYRCSIEGHQDTLYAHSLRQFYRECEIYGTIDFIFGNGAAVLQNCKLYTRVPLPLQKVTITAQGRKSPHQNTGFVIQDSFVLATQPTYLGRPWKQFSRTVYINTYMSGLVQPRGWLEWAGNFALNTLWYGEYKNYGPGSALGGRVKWPGFHIIKDPAAANDFTVQHFIDGGSWLPATGIRFTAGLTN
ncbi:putative pectinesterase/pectinesterase inhibitor 22 [Neltuma alba]|uniref:putative pectinesterase/pectinesterase inhibitor 22 n=1 Tax=Neltuma alba TaxID=207710 RepID=UPI0010A42234|nr:putative pectinesterase/pectinesterase inhibitor 22 [Prosopis alba]